MFVGIADRAVSQSANFGDTLRLSGQIYSPQSDGTFSPSQNDRQFPLGEIKNGQLRFEDGVPPSDYLSPLNGNSSVFSHFNSFSVNRQGIFTGIIYRQFDSRYYNDVRFSDTYVRYAFISGFQWEEKIREYNFYVALQRANISGINSTENATIEGVHYIYVDRDVTVSGNGKTTTGNDGTRITSNFTLNLKEGWNALYTRSVLDIGRKTLTETISVANPDHVRWVLDGGI